MIDLEFVESLIRALDQSSLDSIEIERGGTRLRLSKTPDPGVVMSGGAAPRGTDATPLPSGPPPGEPADEPEAPASNLVDVKSPMVGTFYRSPAPDAPAYVDRGSRVTKGDTLCIIEAMKLMNELESDVEGTVAEICVENGEPVEYGQVLLRIDPGS